jgi:endo-1,4-beta-xylanase
MRFFLCFYLLLQASNAIALDAEVMKPGDWITMDKAVESKGLKKYGAAFGNSDQGDWLSFGPLDLQDGLVDRIEIKMAAPETKGKIVIRLDHPKGSQVGEVNIRETGGYDKIVPQQGHSEQLAGTHRVVLVFEDGKNLCNIQSFRFLKPGQKGSKGAYLPNDDPMASTSFSIDDVLNANQKSIEANRTAIVEFKTSPGATVSIQQKKHHFEFGTAINWTGFISNDRTTPAEQDRYQKIILENFNSVVHENAMKWYANEKKQGVLTFSKPEAMLNWANENNLYTRGHCVYWGRDKLVPQWQKDLDDANLRKVLKDRAKVYMERFGDLREHDMNNEMVHCNYYKKRLGGEIWKDMFKWSHEFSPNTLLYVNDYSILSGGDTQRYINQIQGFLKAGVKLGGIGVQGHFGGKSINAKSIKTKLDQLGQFGLPIKITEYDANTKNETRKAESLLTVYATAFAHPAVEGIYMWGFWEKRHWRPNAALWTKDWTMTKAAKLYRELVFKRWWTDETFKADANGICRVRLFHGTHEVNINRQSSTIDLKPSHGHSKMDCRGKEPSQWTLMSK